MNIEGIDIEWLGHDTFRIKNKEGKVIYFDPFKISGDVKADYIFITHEHDDHCSMEDIKKIMTDQTIIVAADKCQSKLAEIEEQIKFFVYMIPDELTDAGDIKVQTFPSYNIDKFREPGVPFHAKEDNKVGMVILVDGKRIYHAGDTDNIPEMADIKNIDIALIPVSGTYVMTADEAAKAVEVIKPKKAIPMHYGDIVGSKEDAEKFKSLVSGDTEVIILEKSN
ncbi:MAG: MBL fold metallo-hydrolase [Candidatus Aenigmatarchaeota archaeon]